MTTQRARFLQLNILLLGVLLRVAQWGYQAPLWHDEAAVIHNVESKNARQLLGPLSESVAAPPGFLLMLRGLYDCFGHSSLLYRLPSLLAGSAAMFCFAALASRLLTPTAALTMTALFALSDRMIWHTVEVKPYAIDTCVAALMLWLFFYIEKPARRITLLSLVATAAIWFSFTTVFVYGGLMILLFVENYRDRRSRWAGFLGGMLFAASLAAVYFWDVRPQRTPGLQQTWAPNYLPASPLHWATWLLSQLIELCDYSTKNVGLLVLILVLLGAIFLWQRRSHRILAVLILPIFLTLLAACASLYPFGGSRATLFLVPSVFVLCGFGLNFLAAGRQKWGKILCGAIAAFLILWMAALAGYHVVWPRMRTPAIRELAGYIHDHYQPRDAIYVWAGRNGPGEFTDYWNHHVGKPGDPLFPLQGATLQGRFWIVLIDATEFRRTVDMPDLAEIRAGANQKAHFSTRGGEAYLFLQR